MGIGVQGEACGEVTQHTGHRLDVYTILQCDGCEGVAEVVESDLRDTSPFENPLQHIVHTVRGDGTTVRRGKHIGVVALALLLPQDFDCLGRDADGPVGVLGFQRRFHDFAIHSRHLPPYLDNAVLPVDVLPFQSEEFTSTQTGGELNVVHLIDTTPLGFFQKGTEMLHRHRLHFLVFYLGELTGIGGIGQDDLLRYCKIHILELNGKTEAAYLRTSSAQCLVLL